MERNTMADTRLADDPQTMERLDSVARLAEWVSSMPTSTRRRFLSTIAECCDEIQQVVASTLSVIKTPETTEEERHRALAKIAEALSLSSTDTLQATFADRLRELMDSRKISQSELADRIGCSQPAVSQMLTRKCRPQKKTILRLAEALDVPAEALWPDIEVADMLDAVADFERDDYVMTQEEAQALGDTSRRNPPKIPAKPLPKRRR
jgi:transcriptional regulator with XRE-family HTH domain